MMYTEGHSDIEGVSYIEGSQAGHLIKCNKRSKIMQHFMAHYVANCNFFQLFLSYCTLST